MMGFVSSVVSGIGNAITGAVKAVGDLAGDVLKTVGDAVGSVVKTVGKTVEAVLKDPLPTLLQIGGSFIGIPPYVTAAVITAAKGGKLEDIAKSAAISYASTQILSNTDIGKTIGDTTKTWGNDFTNNMMKTFDLPPDTAVSIAKSATAALNSSVIGGINAAISGKSIATGITSGFTSGLVYSSTDSFFDSINKDPNWGFSDKAVSLMKGATSTALNTFISGKGDPAQAVGNYIAYAALNMGGTSLAQSAKEAYKLLTTDTEAAKAAQDKYTTLKADYDQKIKDGETLRTTINDESAAYKKVVDEQYNPFKEKLDDLIARNTQAVNEFNAYKQSYDDNKWAYENYEAKIRGMGFVTAVDDDGNISGAYKNVPNGPPQWDWESGSYYQPTRIEWGPTRDSYANEANNAAGAANSAADRYTFTKDAVEKLTAENKDMVDGLVASGKSIDTKMADLQKIKDDVEKPNADGTNLAAKVKAASDAYQTKYDAWAKTKEAADRSAENYTKALAEAATRNATIDALNTGAIKTTSKDADGNWTLSNGMTLTSDGKFMQDGKQAFTNTAGIPQAVLDFKAADGTKVDFNENAGRVMSTTDVQSVMKRDYNLDVSEDEAKKFAGTTYGTTDAKAMNDFTNQKVRDAYFQTVGAQPTDAQVTQIRATGGGGNDLLTSAKEFAVNGLDLPEDYKFPDTNTKVSFGQAYAAARAAYGPNATFNWTNPTTGKTGLYTTENREEKIVRDDTAAAAAGKYDTQVSSYAKYKMLDNLSSPDFNPADLTKGEMSKFVDAYTNASPLQRAAMLKGSDSSTYKVIDTILNETARYNPTGQINTTYKGTTTGTISAYNPTGVEKILDSVRTGKDVLNAGLNIATADVAGVVTRGAQLLRDAIGLDNTTADKIQQMWSDSKDKSLKGLATDNQRVIAGGIASGLESVGAFATSGPVGALMTLGAIAANNSYQEGATTWIDNNGKAYSSKDEAARAAGVSNIRQLTPEENMQRTAVMTALEIAGEAAGIPGMTRLMKGIPLTGNTGQIVNAVKNFGVGLGNEQVSELLTTTAQMAADKWLSFGLGKDATLADYTKALQDTALATTAAVGTAGSISTATRNMQDLKSYSNPFSTNTGLDTISPTVPSLKQAAATLGLSESDFATIQRNVTNSVRAGNAYIGSAEDLISQSLQDKGMSTVKADAVASILSQKLETVAVTDFLTANGIDPAKIPALTPLIQSQLDPNINTAAAAKNIASIFASAGMDPALAGKTASTFYSNTVAAPTITQADIDLSNQLMKNAGLEVGKVYISPKGTTTTVTSTPGTTVTNDQLQTTFGTTGTTGTTTTTGNTAVGTGTTTGATTGTTTGGTAGTGTTTGSGTTTGGTTGTTTGGTTGTTTGGTTGTTTGTTTGGTTGGTTGTFATTGTLTGGTTGTTNTTATTNTASTGLDSTAVQNMINTAISGIKLPAGVTKDDVAAAITTYMTANPGMNATDVANAVANYMKSNPQLTATDVNTAITNATKNFATKADIETAIAGIQFPAGVTKADVTSAINAAIAANPTLTAADVATQISNYMKNNPGVTAADVTNAVTNATKNLVTQTNFDSAIKTLTQAQQDQYNQLSQAQKDLIASQFKQGVDLSTSIAGVQKNVTNLETSLTTRINDLINQGVNQQTAIQQAIKETQGQITTGNTQVNQRIADLISQGMTNQQATETAIKETQGQVTNLGNKVDLRINELIQQGLTNQQATQQAIKETQGQVTQTKEELTNQIEKTNATFNQRVNELVEQGKTYQEATQQAFKETNQQIGEVQKAQDEAKKREEEAAKVSRVKEAQSKTASSLAQAVSLAALPAAAAAASDETTPFKNIGLKTTGESKFEGPLEQYLKLVKGTNYAQKPAEAQQQQTQQQVQQGANVQQDLLTPQPEQPVAGSDYFNYGQQTDIDKLLAGQVNETNTMQAKRGGLATPLFAGGGTTRYGRYAGGGLNVINHSGKARVDFRTGDAVTGPGDGQSDDIPAMLADGEFVFPADVVSALGNGSTKAGSDKLYDMMHSIRAYHRSAKPEDLPPPAKKSPLDYLKTRKARR